MAACSTVLPFSTVMGRPSIVSDTLSIETHDNPPLERAFLRGPSAGHCEQQTASGRESQGPESVFRRLLQTRLSENYSMVYKIHKSILLAKGQQTGGKRLRTRARLIDAAVDVVREKGFYKTTLEEVARRAGMTRGAVYGNFKDKDELLLA